MRSQNAVLARRWFEEVWNQRRGATIHEFMAPECVGHHEDRDTHGPGDFEVVHQGLLKAFPDLGSAIGVGVTFLGRVP